MLGEISRTGTDEGLTPFLRLSCAQSNYDLHISAKPYTIDP
jgi:hypothetical protein